MNTDTEQLTDNTLSSCLESVSASRAHHQRKGRFVGINSIKAVVTYQLDIIHTDSLAKKASGSHIISLY